MSLRDPETMNAVIGRALRYGVIVSAVIVGVGILRLGSSSSYTDIATVLAYNAGVIPHGNYDVSLGGIARGLATLDPFSLIELGVIVLIATPVVRVLISVFLFGVEGDRKYVVITAVVLALLLFSMLATPLLPGFHA